MAKVRTVFFCQSCGYQSAKWLGRCPDCNGWGTLIEERVERPAAAQSSSGPQPESYPQISVDPEERFSTKIPELDRVLGGGAVKGSAVLIGGDPGIGKSTLLLQALERIGKKALYVSGEESVRQIRMRGERLSISAENLFVLAETSLERILARCEEMDGFKVVAVDSVQTIYSEALGSSPGTVSQVREVAAAFLRFAKQSGATIFLVGHVTKDGVIAGPRVLEHLVDTVLYFEGDGGHSYRLLRAVKNRFGSTNEIGLFEMGGGGLIGVENASAFFLSERSEETAGSAIVVTVEGTRPLLIEVQALVSPSFLSMPRRTANGLDANRVSLLLAVLDRRAGLHFSGQDVYVNVVSGISLNEPAVDLAVAAALASSLRERPIPGGTILFGEIGLSGEIRAVHQSEARLKEGAKLGFKRAILPEVNLGTLKKREGFPGLELIGVKSVREALEAI